MKSEESPLSHRLQRHLARDLVSRHPLPWTTEADWTLEVYDARKQLVTKLMSRDEFDELHRFVSKIAKEDGDCPDAQPCAGDHSYDAWYATRNPEELEILDPVCLRCGWQTSDLAALPRPPRT